MILLWDEEATHQVTGQGRQVPCTQRQAAAGAARSSLRGAPAAPAKTPTPSAPAINQATNESTRRPASQRVAQLMGRPLHAPLPFPMQQAMELLQELGDEAPPLEEAVQVGRRSQAPLKARARRAGRARSRGRAGRSKRQGRTARSRRAASGRGAAGLLLRAAAWPMAAGEARQRAIGARNPTLEHHPPPPPPPAHHPPPRAAVALLRGCLGPPLQPACRPHARDPRPRPHQPRHPGGRAWHGHAHGHDHPRPASGGLPLRRLPWGDDGAGEPTRGAPLGRAPGIAGGALTTAAAPPKAKD
jgi:hypothetical protein